MSMPIAQGEWVVVEIDREKRKEGGVFLSDIGDGKPKKGWVVSVGEGRRTKKGVLVGLDVLVGDEVMFPMNSGKEIVDGEKMWYMIRASDIEAVIGRRG